MSDEIYLGPNVAELDYGDKLARISRINLAVDSDHIYTSGDDTGRTLEVDCPWGSQEMADSILAKVSAVDYQPYAAEQAILDPAAEVGDGVTVGGIYSQICASNIEFDRMCVSDISAPESDEIDDEYPYESGAQRAIERKLAYTRSLITKTSESILLQIEGLEDNYSRLEQYVDSLTLSVSNGSESSTISLKAGSTTIASQNISFSGMVTFTDLSTAGGTTINGSNITTGTLYADYIKLYGNLSVYTSKTGSTVGGYLGYTSSTLDGGAGIHIMNSAGTGEVRVTASGAAMEAPGGGKVVCTSNCNISGDYIYFYAGSGGFEMGSTYFAPQTSGNRYCGLSGQRWSTVYCTAVNESSDRALKTDISYDNAKYNAFFDGLKPCNYKFATGEENEAIQTGLIADDVAKALTEAGLSLEDFGGLQMSSVAGESGIVYSRFIPLLIDQLQGLKKRVATLEGKV